MRLIIKDYLLCLREKDELDLLLCDLLPQMGYATDSQPKTGSRQYGVDIRAHNDEEILLCVVKQGNMDRRIWSADPNAVRQSLEDIRDVYMRFLRSELRGKRLHIAVVSNGVIEETVYPNWTGYVDSNVEWDGVPVQLEFWDINMLVLMVQEHLLNECMFEEAMRSQLRKALYFVEEGDYPNRYFEQIINGILDAAPWDDSGKKLEKQLAGLYLVSQMIAHYAAEANLFKIAVMVSEYLLLRYWNALLTHNCLEKHRHVLWLCKYLKMYEKWNQKYYAATSVCAETATRFPGCDSVEQRILLYELLGYWTSYAYWLSFAYKHDRVAQKSCRQVCDSIVGLLNHYPQLFYPPYDGHIAIISMVFRLLLRFRRREEVCALVQRLCNTVAYNYVLYQKYPVPDDCYETAVNLSLGLPVPSYQCSAFWGTMLEWIAVLGQNKLYENLLPFFQEKLQKVTHCVWFLRAEEESAFYAPHAISCAGEGIVLDVPSSFMQLETSVYFLLEQFSTERFSYDTYAFPALEMIVCRYYGYIPRINLESDTVN